MPNLNSCSHKNVQKLDEDDYIDKWWSDVYKCRDCGLMSVKTPYSQPSCNLCIRSAEECSCYVHLFTAKSILDAATKLLDGPMSKLDLKNFTQSLESFHGSYTGKVPKIEERLGKCIICDLSAKKCTCARNYFVGGTWQIARMFASNSTPAEYRSIVELVKNRRAANKKRCIENISIE
jgi:hypothetical protein